MPKAANVSQITATQISLMPQLCPHASADIRTPHSSWPPLPAAGDGSRSETATKKTAIDLTLAIFEINAIDRTIEIAQFAFFDRWGTQGAGELLQLLEHGKPLFVYLPSIKIGEQSLFYQRRILRAAMHQSHGTPMTGAIIAYLKSNCAAGMQKPRPTRLCLFENALYG
jgi:hypothetical protein